jgi:hypothetical protein
MADKVTRLEIGRTGGCSILFAAIRYNEENYRLTPVLDWDMYIKIRNQVSPAALNAFLRLQIEKYLTESGFQG